MQTISKLLPSLLRYICTGGAVFIVDVGTFHLLTLAHVYITFAATISYGLAVIAHFLLNKFLTFRNFDRSTAHQLRTYLVVVTFCWLITLLVIEIGVHLLGITPLAAKLVAVIINIPVGFLCHRYLTFGAGVSVILRRLKRSRTKR